jgi:hypothetical protein
VGVLEHVAHEEQVGMAMLRGEPCRQRFVSSSAAWIVSRLASGSAIPTSVAGS